jgi:hypothetical protein
MMTLSLKLSFFLGGSAILILGMMVKIGKSAVPPANFGHHPKPFYCVYRASRCALSTSIFGPILFSNVTIPLSNEMRSKARKHDLFFVIVA